VHARTCQLRGGSGGVTGLKAQSMYDKIEEKLTAGLKPTKLSIVDNSHQHAGHAGVNGRVYASLRAHASPGLLHCSVRVCALCAKCRPETPCLG
jgi:hypothetical protein